MALLLWAQHNQQFVNLTSLETLSLQSLNRNSRPNEKISGVTAVVPGEGNIHWRCLRHSNAHLHVSMPDIIVAIPGNCLIQLILQVTAFDRYWHYTLTNARFQFQTNLASKTWKTADSGNAFTLIRNRNRWHGKKPNGIRRSRGPSPLKPAMGLASKYWNMSLVNIRKCLV